MTISNFNMISLDGYKKRGNKVSPEKEARINRFIKLRDNGTPCQVCNLTPIWALGSAACGWPGCFVCITGETDASDDFEIL